MLLPSANSSGDSEIFIQKPPSFLYWISTYWEPSMCWAQLGTKEMSQVDRSLTYHHRSDPITEWVMGGSRLDSRLGCSVVMNARAGRECQGWEEVGWWQAVGLGSLFRGAAIRGVRMKGIVTKVLHTEFASVKSGRQISLATQWLGLHPFMPMAQVQALSQGIKIPQAVWHGQKNK